MNTRVFCPKCGEYTQDVQFYDMFNLLILPPCPKCNTSFQIKLEVFDPSVNLPKELVDAFEEQADDRQKNLDAMEADPLQLGTDPMGGDYPTPLGFLTRTA